MSMGIAGMLLIALGALMVAAGWFYFELSLWLLIPGGSLTLIGASLINGYLEQVRLSVMHQIADRQESKNKGSEDSAP